MAQKLATMAGCLALLAMVGCAGEEITLEEAIQYGCYDSGVTDFDMEEVVTGAAPWGIPGIREVRASRVSGGGIHRITEIYDIDDGLMQRVEDIWLVNGGDDGGHYQRESLPGSPDVWGEWESDEFVGGRTFPNLCLGLDGEDLERVGRLHYASQDDEVTANVWLNADGLPRRMLFEYERGQIEVTYSGIGEPNEIVAP